MTKKKAIKTLILCGGQGSRLKSILPNTPKALAAVKDTPFIDILVNQLTQIGARPLIFCTGHLAKDIQSHIQKTMQDTPFLFSNEKIPLGTGGAIINAMPHFIDNDIILVVNGDSYCQIDLTAFYTFHQEKKATISIALVEVNNANRYGNVTLGPDNIITHFQEKTQETTPGLINAGAYLISKKAWETLSKAPLPCSIEKDIFPQFINNGLYGFPLKNNTFIDIGTETSLNDAQTFQF